MTTDAHITECVTAIHHMKMRHAHQPVTLAWPPVCNAGVAGSPGRIKANAQAAHSPLKPTRKPPAVRAFLHLGVTHSVYTTAVEVADQRVSEADTVHRALELSRVAEAALVLLSRSVSRYRAIPRWRRDIRVPKRKA